MRIYVACLRAYNNGQLHGSWFDMDSADADDVHRHINEVLNSSPAATRWVVADEGTRDEVGEWQDSKEEAEKLLKEAGDGHWLINDCEEWAIHDYEDIDGFGENPDIDKLVEYCECAEELGEAWKYYVDMVGKDYATKEGFEEAYAGEYRSKEDWAEQFMDDTGGLEGMPENLKCYFDYEKYARDCELGGDMYFAEVNYDKVYAFHNH